MATTSPPLPTLIDANNQPVSYVIPDLIDITDLTATAPIVPFTNPSNCLHGATNTGGTPAVYTNNGTNQDGRLAVGFTQFKPTSTVLLQILYFDYSVTNYTNGSAVVEYSIDGGNTWINVVTLTGNTAEVITKVQLALPQNLTLVIIRCRCDGVSTLTFNIYGLWLGTFLNAQTSLIPPFPGQQNIGELMTRVASKLGNRQDIFAPAYDGGVPQVADWIMRAVLELTQNYDFEELSTTGPLTNTFTPFVNTYSFTWLCNIYHNVQDIPVRVRSWFITTVLSATFFNGQSTGYQLKYRDLAVVEQVAQIPGPPTMYSRIGPNYLVGPMPDNAYATYMRYQFQHPFSFDPNLIASIPIMMPTDWLDIVEYCAAQRGAMELRMLDYADYYMKTVYGGASVNPQTGKSVVLPGLISQRLTQRTRDMSKNERSIKPVVMRTCT